MLARSLPLVVVALLVPAATADAAVSARVAGDTLRITGDERADRITVRKRRGIVFAAGERFDPGGFDRIVVRGRRGRDVLRADAPGERVTLDGGRGSDVLTGGDGRDRLVGGPGRDAADARRGRDSVNLGPGADRFRWDAGDGADRLAGRGGRDRMRLVGTAAPERFAVASGRVTLGRNSLRARFEAFEVVPLGGADRVAVGPGSSVHVDLVVTRGAGSADGDADEVAVEGSRRADAIRIGGSGHEFAAGDVTGEHADPTDRLVVDGRGGADRIDAGRLTGPALTVEGGAGFDRLHVDGSDADEYLEVSPNGDRLRVIRDALDQTVDGDGVEAVEVDAHGGADTIAVNDLAGTDVTAARVAPGQDGRIDGVIVNAADAGHALAVRGAGTSASVAGLTTAVDVAGTEPADVLTVNAGGGDDRIDASGLPAGVVALTLDGGAGTDVVIGSPGADELRWDAGDGAESIEAGPGEDRLLVYGTTAGDTVEIGANGPRLRAARGAEVVDANDVDRIETYAFAGDDAVTTGDLTGTDVTAIHVDAGAGDDALTLHGSPTDDIVHIAPGVAVTGLAASLTVAATERLALSTHDGEDIVDATGLPATALALTVDGGNHDDALTGGDGADTIRGGEGDDVLVGGPGTDDLDGGPGNNTVIQD